METDIGTPFEYEPGIEPENNNNNKVDKDEDTSTPIQEYFHPSDMMYMNQPPPPQYTQSEFFSTIDKSTWIVAFAVFLLGFFMGKTMTPIILKSN